jgi:hypothetical protein
MQTYKTHPFYTHQPFFIEILKNTKSWDKKAIIYFMAPITPGMLLYDDIKKYFSNKN